MRLTIAILVLFLTTAGFASQGKPNFLALSGHQVLDPIITGKRVTLEQHARWVALKAKADACSNCHYLQAFPTD